MKSTTVEGAQLAFDIGPKLMAKFDKRKFPLLFSILECICENKAALVPKCIFQRKTHKKSRRSGGNRQVG